MARLLLDAVAPRRCAGCETAVKAPLCSACLDALAAMRPPRQRRVRHGYAFSAFEFAEPVRSALHRGKYGGDRRALGALARLAADRVCGELGGPPDAVVAVPLGARRRRRRGYNQAEDVAAVIAATAGVPLLPGLVRVRETRAQPSRDEAARRRNVEGAFAWRGIGIEGVRLWLVDDVLTTGATVDAAAGALVSSGARRVDVVVIASVP